VSLTRQNFLFATVVKILNFRRKKCGGIDVDDSVYSRKLRATASIEYSKLYARLEGDFVVIYDCKKIHMLNWKEDKCVEVAMIYDMQWDSLRIVEEHLTCLMSSLNRPGATARNFSLKVVPLRDVFVSIECASYDEDDVMIGTTKGFANLPAFLSEVQAPDDCIPVFATLGCSNRAWRTPRRAGGDHVEEVTFFIISELWHRKLETRYFLLHQAQIEYESESITPSSSSLKVRNRILRATQVGSAVTMTNVYLTDRSKNHWISQSGKIVVNANASFAVSIQYFLSGSDKAPRIILDEHPIEGKDVIMDPQSGAVCCWESTGTTIRILYFD